MVTSNSKIKIVVRAVYTFSKKLLGAAELLVKDIPASATNGHEMDMRCNLKAEDPVRKRDKEV